jgi:hypothetical protein
MAIRMMLESFVETQKYSVMKSMKSVSSNQFLYCENVIKTRIAKLLFFPTDTHNGFVDPLIITLTYNLIIVTSNVVCLFQE